MSPDELLAQVDSLLRGAAEQVPSIQSYRAIVLCQDRIDGKLRDRERIESAYKSPGNVYLRWLPGPYEGLQASYVRSRDGVGKFQARETGLRGMAGTVTWDDDSSVIRKFYPHHFRTHETNLPFLVELSGRISTEAKAKGKFSVLSLSEVADSWLGRTSTRAEIALSKDSADGLRWPRVEFFFDRETKLPLHFRLHAFDGGLFGEYAFVDLKLNVPVADDLFTLKKV